MSEWKNGLERRMGRGRTVGGSIVRGDTRGCSEGRYIIVGSVRRGVVGIVVRRIVEDGVVGPTGMVGMWFRVGKVVFDTCYQSVVRS